MLSVFALAIILIAIGMAGGFFSGMLGVGGGLIFVPALYYYFTSTGAGGDQAMHMAVGTSLALVMVTGATSAFWHNRRKAVDFHILKTWGPYIVAGVCCGTAFASVMSGETLKKFFAVVAVLLSVYMALSREPKDEQPHRMAPWLQKTICALIGTVASMLGIGGAVLAIPLMTYNGVPMRTAIGTGGAFGTVIAVPGMAGYVISGLAQGGELPSYSLGYVNLLALAVIAPLSFALSPVGVRVSHAMPKIALRRVFALVLALISIRMFTQS